MRTQHWFSCSRRRKQKLTCRERSIHFYDSLKQQKLKFIINFLQRRSAHSAKSVQFPQLAASRYFQLRCKMSFCHLFLAQSQLNQKNTVHHQSLQRPRNTMQFLTRALLCFAAFVQHDGSTVGRYEADVFVSHSRYKDSLNPAFY